MSIRSAWILCAIVVLGAYGVLASMTPSLSVPPEIRITLPAPDLAPKLAALSGVWEPVQGVDITSRVVVERIDEARATLLLIGPNHAPGFPRGAWERVRATVLRDGAVEWGYPERFTLRIALGGATLASESPGAVTQTLLRKVGGALPAPEPLVQATLTKTVYQPEEVSGR